MNEVLPGSDGLRIWEFWIWVLDLDEASRFSEFAEARRVVCGGVPHVVGSDAKVSIKRNCVRLSLLMLKTQKDNKKFRTWTKKRVVSVSCFFRIPMFMNMCERFPYRYEYVYFTCSYLGRIFLRGYATCLLPRGRCPYHVSMLSVSFLWDLRH